MTSTVWMSSRFFAIILKESDNPEMIDRHIQKSSYPLRMPDSLRDDLEANAKLNSRSMNAEIIARLQSTFATPVLEPKTHAIDILMMTKTQRLAFLENVERTLLLEKSPPNKKMLLALRDAAMQEIAVIDQQIKGASHG